MKIIKYFPGIILSFVIAALAMWLESLLPIHLIGSAVIAMFIGMIINRFLTKTDIFASGIKFTSKKLLKFAIILLGLSLNITTVLQVGKMSLTVMVFTLLTCFGGGYFIGKALGLNWKLSNLISAGTGICGGSAIAAIAPTIDADDSDVAYAMSATFLFDMAMILLFPIMGRALGMTDQAFGIWAGTAVNDTSSVVATGYAFSEGAGDYATMVKLTRTLSIIPTVITFAFIQLGIKRKEALENSKNSDLSNLICSFGIRHVGRKQAKILARKYQNLDNLMNASIEDLTQKDGIGEVIAQSIYNFFNDAQSLDLIERLKKAGVNTISLEETSEDNRFEGQVFVLTGALDSFSRKEAESIIEKFGGKTSSSVSKKTSYVLAGEEAGSKLARAKELLCNTDAYVKEIAATLGFATDKGFIGYFKYHEGCFPAAFRARFAKMHMNNK